LSQSREVLSVDQDSPCIDVVVAGEDIDQRALAGPRRPTDTDAFARRDIKGVVAQHQAVRYISEVDVLELDAATLELVLDGVGCILPTSNPYDVVVRRLDGIVATGVVLYAGYEQRAGEENRTPVFSLGSFRSKPAGTKSAWDPGIRPGWAAAIVKPSW
jgi:hypothetical protein